MSNTLLGYEGSQHAKILVENNKNRIKM